MKTPTRFGRWLMMLIPGKDPDRKRYTLSRSDANPVNAPPGLREK